MVEYSDYECPFCGEVARETLPTLVREYVDTGKIIVVFKNMPLPFHQFANGAAIAATCGGEQGRFWQMHDQLFTEPVKLSNLDLRAFAMRIGLDLARYDSCVAGTQAPKVVEADRAEAQALGLTSTPTFLFGRLEGDGQVRVSDVLTGAKPITTFRAILDKLLK